MARFNAYRALVVSAGCAFALAPAACGSSSPSHTTTTRASKRTPAAAPAAMITIPAPTLAPDRPCSAGQGIDIPAVSVPELRSDPVRVPNETLNGHTVPGFVVPGILIPAWHVPAQCATIAPAPAGCFGRVSIPSTEIPAVRIPGATIPAVNVPGATQPAQGTDAVGTDAAGTDATGTPQVCAEKVQPGQIQPSVLRPSVLRPSVLRPSVLRPSVLRPSVCDSHEHCVPAVLVPAVEVPAVEVPAVYVPAAYLAARVMPEIKSPCIHVFANKSTTVYQVCTDVLFAFDRSNIRPSAVAVLRQLARSLAKRFPNARLEVDGNTDSVGSATYNQGLSVRRAQAVAAWLSANAGISASRITVRGFGETEPVASNASAQGRALNRRVAIGVLPTS